MSRQRHDGEGSQIGRGLFAFDSPEKSLFPEKYTFPDGIFCRYYTRKSAVFQSISARLLRVRKGPPWSGFVYLFGPEKWEGKLRV